MRLATLGSWLDACHQISDDLASGTWFFFFFFPLLDKHTEHFKTTHKSSYLLIELKQVIIIFIIEMYWVLNLFFLEFIFNFIHWIFIFISSLVFIFLIIIFIFSYYFLDWNCFQFHLLWFDFILFLCQI
jgi:hypothetical protein